MPGRHRSCTHGSLAMYTTHKCRCSECRTAWTEYRRNRNAQRRAAEVQSAREAERLRLERESALAAGIVDYEPVKQYDPYADLSVSWD